MFPLFLLIEFSELDPFGSGCLISDGVCGGVDLVLCLLYFDFPLCFVFLLVLDCLVLVLFLLTSERRLGLVDSFCYFLLNVLLLAVMLLGTILSPFLVEL